MLQKQQAFGHWQPAFFKALQSVTVSLGKGNKTFHLVNDIITEYTKSISKDKESKRAALGISLLVDLAIDFLVKG